MRRPPPSPAARRPTLLSRRLDRGPSMFNKVDVDGRYAVVTGGARWIGRAIAKSLFFRGRLWPSGIAIVRSSTEPQWSLKAGPDHGSRRRRSRLSKLEEMRDEPASGLENKRRISRVSCRP